MKERESERERVLERERERRERERERERESRTNARNRTNRKIFDDVYDIKSKFARRNKRKYFLDTVLTNNPDYRDSSSDKRINDYIDQLKRKRKEGKVLFNDARSTFYLRLYGVGHMVKDHSDRERKERFN